MRAVFRIDVMLGGPRSGDRYQQECWEDEAEDWGAGLRLFAKRNAVVNYRQDEPKAFIQISSSMVVVKSVFLANVRINAYHQISK